MVPTGYSFNLDGTNIYMTLAALFIAQATGIDLSLGDQLLLLLVAMLSSKGAAGITGAGFITLAATLSVVPTVPVAGMALILGVDRFMSECRALTNFVGNAVATLVVARWEGELDRDRLAAALDGEAMDLPEEVEPVGALHAGRVGQPAGQGGRRLRDGALSYCVGASRAGGSPPNERTFVVAIGCRTRSLRSLALLSL